MKKYIVPFVIVLGIILFAALMRLCYLQDKKQEQLLYEVCREQGCSDTECKLFVSFPGNVKVNCANGGYVKKS